MKESPIAKLEEFMRKHCRKELGKIAAEYPEKRSLFVDFTKLEKFDPDLADAILASPSEILGQAEEALNHIDMPIEGDVKLNVRMLNLPDEKNILLRNLRAEHIGKMVTVEGIVRTASDVRPQALVVNFECPVCQSETKVEQTEMKLVEPFQCENPNCGRKGKFKIKNIEFIDSTRIRLQEPPEAIIGSEQPSTLYVELRDDLVAPKERKKILPGNTVKINGVLREFPVKPGMTKYDIFLEANYLETTDTEYEELELSKADIKEIEKTSKDLDIYNKLIDSIAPSIYGYREIKEAILLQLFGGIRKIHPDGTTIRGDIHLFLVGDPGTGKCVSGDTEILLSDGSLKKIGEENLKPSGVVDDGTYACTNHDIISVDFSGKNVETKADIFWKRQAPKNMYDITTQSGREVCVSPTHPFFICEDGTIASKQASDLRKGTFVSTPRELPIFGKPQPLKIEYTRSRAKNAVRLKLPSKTSPEFWRFIALLIGEGYVQIKGEYPMGTMYFTNNGDDLLTEVKDYCKKLGLNPKIRKSHKGKTAKEVYACGIEFCSFLESLGLRTLSAGKDVPDLLFKCSKEEIAAFLGGLFDAEGTVSKKEREISIISASKALIKHTKHLLLRFGIASQYKTTRKRATNSSGPLRTYHRLRISGEDIVTFDKEIGFRCAAKAERLKRVEQHNTNLDVIPSVGDILRRTRLSLGLYQKQCGVPRPTMNHYEHKDRNPSLTALKKIVAAFEKKYSQIEPDKSIAEAISRLKTLSQSDIYWDQIISIKKRKPTKEWVYDLQVPTYHNFVANDIYVHNSQILRYVAQLAPKGKYVSGKGASGAGLTASAIKDEQTGGWILEAGALVLANLGIACVDEFDKMSKEDRSAMHEALEQQTVSIAKAGIVTSLNTRTAVLAAANPKYGRFDPYRPVSDQVELGPAILSRFDLKFPIKDVPSAEGDKAIAEHILKTFMHPKTAEPPFKPEFLRKYIAYSRRHATPKLTNEARKMMEDFYVEWRTKYLGDESGNVPLTARQLEAMVRLAEASARVRLDTEIRPEDTQRATKLLENSLKALGTDPETGKIDIDRIETGISSSQRSRIHELLEIVKDLEQSEGKRIPIESLLREAKERGMSQMLVEELIDKLKQKGDLFEPRPGHIQKP